MKVAHVITRMIIGGAQENTLYNCLDLVRDHGDEVMLITGPATGPEGDLLRQHELTGLTIREIPSLIRSITPLSDMSSYRAIKKAIADFKPDVVHTHSAKGGMLGRMAAWSLRVPAVIHTVHGAPFHHYQSWPARKFFIACERYAAGRCHHLVSVADAMTELMVSAGVAPREKFTTIYSGMDIEPFLRANEHRDATRERFGFSNSDVVIGKIARLFHLKGHADLIAAAQQVIADAPKVKFLLVGDGLLREQLIADIARRGLTKHFVFTGLVPPREIPALIGAMDILVHTSLREGLARALPQALLAGKPVVSYDIDGAREVVVANETGALIPPKDVSALAKSLIMLARDRPLRDQLGGAGQGRCKTRFDHHEMTRQIRALYERVRTSS
jgi:glycosyltransferase involved in cell wall biosynthesis